MPKVMFKLIAPSIITGGTSIISIKISPKTKDLQVFAGGAKKADWDVGMAIDAIKMGPKLDTVILATGDGDFIPAIEYLKTACGCQVEIISFGRSSSSKPKEVVDEFVDMDEDYKRYIIKTREKGAQKSTSKQRHNNWGSVKRLA